VSLVETREALIDEIQEGIAVIADYHPMKEIGEVFENLASQFQALGICNLLLSSDMEGLSRNLVMSGFTRRYFLSRCEIEGNRGDEHLAVSRNESIFDLLAVDAQDLANEVVGLSSRDWIPDGEYEDDFCYYFFIHNYIQRYQRSDKKVLEQILNRFELCLESEITPRLRICRSLFSLDQQEFEAALEDLIREREDQVDSGTDIDNLVIEPRRHIFVEGLGLLHIAAKAGFVIENEYKYCPNVMERGGKHTFPEDIYMQMERQYPR